MKSNSIKYWLKAVKIVLWISLVGFGLTLFNTAGLVFTSNDMVASVRLKVPETVTIGNGELKANSGTFHFKSNRIADKLIFRHVYGYHDFIQSAFTFITCLIILITINKINSNNPFALIIARRILLIGTLYILFGLLNIGAEFYIAHRVESITNQVTGNYTSFREDLSNIKVGVFILIFSLIYRIGITFQEENQLTV